jgi:hypothetical protein
MLVQQLLRGKDGRTGLHSWLDRALTCGSSVHAHGHKRKMLSCRWGGSATAVCHACAACCQAHYPVVTKLTFLAPLQECTFKPQTGRPPSKQLLTPGVPVEERLQLAHASRQQALSRARADKEQEQLADCTFAPQVSCESCQSPVRLMTNIHKQQVHAEPVACLCAHLSV